MLKQWIPAAKPDKEELDKRLDAAQEELLRLQMQIKEHKLPVLVLIELLTSSLVSLNAKSDAKRSLLFLTC